MLKMYKKNGGYIEYAECWVDNGIAVLHTGTVGDEGKTVETPDIGDAEEHERGIGKQYGQKGYAEWPQDQLYWVVAQIPVESVETGIRLVRPIEDELNNDLGWLGLGHVDGNDIGLSTEPGTQKFVINFFTLVVDKDKGCLAVRRTMQEKCGQKQVEIACRRYDEEGYTLAEPAEGKEAFWL